jgi:hypothetical protein
MRDVSIHNAQVKAPSLPHSHLFTAFTIKTNTGEMRGTQNIKRELLFPFFFALPFSSVCHHPSPLAHKRENIFL